jgi:hypothetical protein
MNALSRAGVSGLLLRPAHTARLSVRHCCRILFAIVILLMTWRFCAYLSYALQAIRYPFALDYGEGIVWQQALLIPGPRMYGDITHYPFIVFHYPPLYHLIVRAVAALGADFLVAGRSVSVVSTLAVGALVASLSFHASRDWTGRPAALAGAAVAGLSMFCYSPIIVWSPLMRVDMLAMAFSFFGVWCAVRSVADSRQLYLAVIAFVLAVYTKQTCIAAPLAAMPLMLLVDRARAIKAWLLGLLIGLIALAVLMWLTDGNFLRHIILYNLNRYSWSHALLLIAVVLQRFQSGFLALGIAGVWVVRWRLAAKGALASRAALQQEIRASRSSLTAAVLVLYFLTSSATLSSVGKSGASGNYFIEWLCVCSALIGTLTATLLHGSLPQAGNQQPRALRPVPLLLAPALLIGLLSFLPSSAAENYVLADSERNLELSQLLASIEHAKRPVLSDDMVLLMKAGKMVPWEPAIFTELAATGRWNERPIIDLITARAFAFIITWGQPGQVLFDRRYQPAVAQAIVAAYPYTQHCAGMTVRLSSDRHAPGASGCVFIVR